MLYTLHCGIEQSHGSQYKTDALTFAHASLLALVQEQDGPWASFKKGDLFRVYGRLLAFSLFGCVDYLN